MNYFSQEYQKFLVEHYVFDAWQFICNARKNLVTAKYCYNIINTLIDKMTEEHKAWQDEINQRISQQLEKNGACSVSIYEKDMPDFNVDILGMQIGYSFLVDKYVKDFFQYVRNLFDSMAQIVNSALLANESKDIEIVDFIKIINILSEKRYSSLFPKTLSFLIKIKNSIEFSYVNGFNNRVKHICDAKVTMSLDLFGNNVSSKIDAFYKKGTQFTEQDILTITKNVMEFIEREFILFMDVLTEEIKLDTFVQGRIHHLSFYAQQIKDEPQNSFAVIFVEVEESIDELPEYLRILLVNENKEIISSNCDYDEILVRDKNKNFVGKFVRDEIIKRDGLMYYRRYKKERCDGVTAFVDHTRKKHSIKIGLMSGKIVRIGFDKEGD